MSYVLKRVGISIILFWIVSIIVFTLIKLQPGNPFTGMISADTAPDYIEQRMQELGYKDPIPQQYVKWFSRTIAGDLGYSLQYKSSVAELIRQRLKNTLLLSGTAFVLTIIISCITGVYTAYKKDTKIDYSITLVSFFIISIPSFFIALLCIKFFSFDLGILPPSGITTAGSNFTGIAKIKDIITHMILPVSILSIVQSAGTMRYIRAAMHDVFHEDYMQTAKAKGLSQERIIWIHGFRNILVPVITLFTLQFPYLLSGAVLTETVFVWPGIGRLSYDVILAKDYPVIMGVTLFISALVIAMNLLSDILNVVITPRLRFKNSCVREKN